MYFWKLDNLCERRHLSKKCDSDSEAQEAFWGDDVTTKVQPPDKVQTVMDKVQSGRVVDDDLHLDDQSGMTFPYSQGASTANVHFLMRWSQA